MFEEIQKERKNIRFDPTKLSYLLHGKQNTIYIQKVLQDGKNLTKHDPNIFNKSRVDQLKECTIDLNKKLAYVDPFKELTFIAGVDNATAQDPGTVHFGMFIHCLNILGTESQNKEFMEKCMKYQIIGAYAQTELGHGSDVQNLQTTAEFDQKTDEFILNTPTTSSIKWWPGQLGLWCNWAMLFAKLIINGVSQGVYPFLVQVRDSNYEPMPGVEVGDIGPKYGFNTKDNGYLILNNVRIPKKNMLRKYVSVGKNGEIKKKGNPKISYATMMIIRKWLSTIYTRKYGQAIAIAGRYSIMRKQFKNDKKQEIKIIDYQLQQNKIIGCLAQYYAITISGNKLTKLTELNFKLVSEQDDDSLMAETHNCLCLGKAYYTDTCLRGMQICRLACGGHGFSHYSGLPGLIREYSPNVTLEGENTILFLQLARYIMKAYTNTLTKKKQLPPSVKYIESHEFLLQKKCNVPENGWSHWNLENIRVLLAQSTCYIITTVAGKFMANEGGSQKATWDKHTGIRLYDLANQHAAYYTYTSFEEAAIKFTDEILKQILFDLCLLFGINCLLNKPQALIEGQLIQPHQLKSMGIAKQNLLKRLRPQLIGLLDGIGVHESTLKSALVTGNVYENMFNLAKQNQINHQINEGVWILKKGLKNCQPKL